VASDSGRKRLLVLGAGPAQLGLLEAARARGLFTIAVDRDTSAPGFALADRRAIISAEDERGIERLARAERIDGVIAPGIDWPVGIAARVAAKLGISHPLEPAVAGVAVSKAKQRERFAAAGVPQPRWKLVADVEDDLPLPCVVKAPDRQGQRGLAVVQEKPALAPAIAGAVDVSRSRAALVEELVDGLEVTVTAFSVGGEFFPVTVTDRITADPPAFGVALAHVWPSGADAGAADVARSAVEALGIRDGPTYTQVRFGPGGPRVMEVAARLGGGHDAELADVVVSVDLNRLAVQAALGEEIDPASLRTEPRVGGACTLFLTAEPGRLEAVEGVEEAEQQEGVLRVRIYRRRGSVIGEFRRGADRVGAIQAVGRANEALERARAAAALIRFQTDAALV